MVKPKKKSRIALARQRQRRYRKFVGKARLGQKETPDLNYKDVGTLQKYLSPQGKLMSRKRTGFSAQGQSRLKMVVKQARYVGLLSPLSGR